jgi:CRP/FNR family transcriptional regulator
MNAGQLTSFFRKLPYFAFVSEDQLEKLTRHAIHHQFAPEQIIFLEGEQSSGLVIVEEGQVKAFKLSPDGQEYILQFFGPGDVINILAALDNLPNVANTMAVTQVETWTIPVEVFSAALHADHELTLAVLKGLVGRMRELVGRVEDLALRPITARLANFLLEQIKDPTLSHPTITRVLIANYLATTPESISRSLRNLEAAGAIQFDRHRIIIVNLDILRQIAQL